MHNLIIWLNNLLRGNRKKKFAPADVLVMFSHCLQNSDCPQKIIKDLAECKRCGKCVVKDVLELSERYKVQCSVASGGQMALAKCTSGTVKAIVAIACEKELSAGIKGIYPKPVIAVPNTRPYGPCKDCLVDIGELEKSVRDMVGDAV
ncbi:MAG: DUF116 domain-containing protein [Planctomycetes bacterium]|nr:DUF116 domain-containing protein [Planctomycetota bacterium]